MHRASDSAKRGVYIFNVAVDVMSSKNMQLCLIVAAFYGR